MKLTIFAATGGIGRLVLEQAVAAGHDVTAVVRNPKKLSREVHLVRADLASPDPAVLESAVKGADAVISALGPVSASDAGVAWQGTRAIVQAMQAYASGALGKQEILFEDTDRIIAIGSDRMMAAVALARRGVLLPYLKPGHVAIGSINSPMQCMMKEICAQCLQPHVDPRSGVRSHVFSCFNQDQPLDRVDWTMLNERLRQQALSEKLTALWIDRCLKLLPPPAERRAA